MEISHVLIRKVEGKKVHTCIHTNTHKMKALDKSKDVGATVSTPPTEGDV